MNELPSYVVSDIHLGAVPPTTERAFRKFLDHLNGRTLDLLINGDLFDFWFEYRSVILSSHYRVLSALTELREAGVRIRFLGGNHDAWGGRFLREEVGIEVLEEGVVIDLAGRTATVVHGDGVGHGDLGYRALKQVIRNPVSIRLFRLLHPDLGSRLASIVSTTGAKEGTPSKANSARATALREWAIGELDRHPEIDLVLAGHTHTPVVDEVRPGRYYVNTGDWINHFTYLTVPSTGPPELHRWDVS